MKLSGEGGRSVEIDVGVRSSWCSGRTSVTEIISEPLSLEEIYEVEQVLGSSDVTVSWNVDAYGFLDEELSRKYGLDPGLLVHISIPSEGFFVIAHQDFVKNILEPADMLRRLFIEVVWSLWTTSY
mgnify:CR=1 FL=1